MMLHESEEVLIMQIVMLNGYGSRLDDVDVLDLDTGNIIKGTLQRDYLNMRYGRLQPCKPFICGKRKLGYNGRYFHSNGTTLDLGGNALMSIYVKGRDNIITLHVNGYYQQFPLSKLKKMYPSMKESYDSFEATFVHNAQIL